MNWETFTRRTNDPKLTYVETLLDEEGIPHRRQGESAHAPILEVPASDLDKAWDLLSRPILLRGKRIPLDDIEDNDPFFEQVHGPNMWEGPLAPQDT